MISRVAIKNFKNLRDLTIELEPLTVLVGANACGKTSVLEAIQLAEREMSDGHSPGQISGERHLDWIYTRGGSGGLSITLRTEDGVTSFEFPPPSGFPPRIDRMGTCLWSLRLAHPDTARIAQQRLLVSPLQYLRLVPATIAKPSYSEAVFPEIGPDGEGTASVLAYMALNDPDSFNELTRFVRELVPGLRQIRFRKVVVTKAETEWIRIGDSAVERSTPRSYSGEAILFDYEHAKDVAAHTLSEGTLILLGFMTVLFGPMRPKVVLMDDLEHGLHPKAQKSLLASLRRVMKMTPGLQIIATSHSPYLLDELRPEEVRLMTVDAEGHAVCGQFKDHPHFAQWKDEMAPGELWSLLGEQWLTERGAASCP